MKSAQLFIRVVLFFIAIVFGSVLYQGCKPDDCDDENEPGECDTCIMVLKPNIYIYPEEKTQLEVVLSFPKGGKVVTSIPYYGDGWNVSVDKNGLIDNTWDYLFYESSQPDVWQLSEGWVVKQTDLNDFFSENMALYGFAGKEISDFTDYWVPRLNYSEYFEVYPQPRALIETVIQLNISKQPNHLLRLFYVIKPSDQPAGFALPEPQIQDEFKREGFYITEWGVVLK